jgi:hypothetical protein
VSQEWLDIQSFFADHEVLGAITDLSLAVKYELAGVRDADREKRAKKAREVVRDFLTRLDRVSEHVREDRVVSLDHRSKELVDAFRAARSDRANYHSVLMLSGAQAGAELLGAADRRSKEALLESLDELRRVVSRHQQASLSAIVEDF